MVEFRGKINRFNVELGVTMGQPDGTEERKVLSFDCSPERYTWITEVLQVGEELKGIDTYDTLESFKSLYPMVKKGFEVVAPGKFDEYFAFTGENITDLLTLLLLMIDTVTKKGIELKTESIITAIPENAETI